MASHSTPLLATLPRVFRVGRVYERDTVLIAWHSNAKEPTHWPEVGPCVCRYGMGRFALRGKTALTHGASGLERSWVPIPCRVARSATKAVPGRRSLRDHDKLTSLLERKVWLHSQLRKLEGEIQGSGLDT